MLKRRIQYGWLLLASLILTVGCDKDGSAPDAQKPTTFRVETSAATIGKAIQPIEISIIYDGAWTLEYDHQSWFTLDKDSGHGDSKVIFTPKDEFEGLGSRIAQIRVQTEKEITYRDLVLTQERGRMNQGDLIVLQTAREGAGIDIVVLGDGFVYADMSQDGRWQAILEQTLEALFKVQPFTAYRDHFNVYSVVAESNSGRIGTTPSDQTYFRSYFNGDRQFFLNTADRNRAYNFAFENTPAKSIDEMLVIMLVNHENYGGAGYMQGENRGMGVSSVMSTGSEVGPLFEYLIIHESLGHSFGKLADEYASYGGSIPEGGAYGTVQSLNDRANYGWWQNIDFTDDPSKVYWKHLLGRGYDDVSIIEGGHYYPEGVWRSSDNSLMRNNNVSYFNTVSREILVRKIHKLAGKTYSLEDFITKDQAAARGAAPVQIAVPPISYHRSPILIRE